MNKTREIVAPPDATKSPGAEADALKEEIGRTRSDLGETLTAIEQKLHPTVLREKAVEEIHVVEGRVRDAVKEQFEEAKATIRVELSEAKETAKREVQNALIQAKQAVRAATIGKVETMARRANATTIEARDSILDTIWQNPLPTALAGVGLAWLYMNRKSAAEAHGMEYYGDSEWRRPGSREGRNGHGPSAGAALHDAQDAAGRVVQKVQHKAADLVGSASDAASHATQAVGNMAHDAADVAGRLASQVSEGASHIAHDAGELGTHLAERARFQARRVDASLHQTMQSNPMAVGAAVLAAGALVGLALPRTRREDELMGETRDHFIDQARNTAQEAVGKAKQIAHGVEEVKAAVVAKPSGS